jgi:hypothetical protein
MMPETFLTFKRFAPSADFHLPRYWSIFRPRHPTVPHPRAAAQAFVSKNPW